MSFARLLYVLALCVWLGETIFLSLIVAPTLFRNFPTPQAGEVMSALFPSYYQVGYGCGAVLLVSAVVLARGARRGAGTWGGAALVSGLMLATVLYAGLVVQPRVHALRPQLREPAVAPEVKAEFDQLHRRSVQLNGAVLVGGLLLAGLTATRLKDER